LPDARSLVSGEVVHNHELSWPQVRCEHFLGVGLEGWL
jgi:hypothetical protein